MFPALLSSLLFWAQTLCRSFLLWWGREACCYINGPQALPPPLTREQEAQEYQESLFGQEGTLMKKRLELIQPIQKKVFDAIEAYAKQVGAAAVIDSSNNPTLLYASPSAEHTQQVIELLKK